MSKIIVSGPVIIENNQVLLTKHKDSFWKFPGGMVENNETYRETARREVAEEMGIEINILNNTPFITYTEKEAPEGKIDVVLVHFLAGRIGEIRPGKDIREWHWHSLDSLPDDLGPNIVPALKHFGYLT